jgi:hypothetical protein
MVSHNMSLKLVPAAKSAAFTGLANARRLAGRYPDEQNECGAT